MPLLARGWRSRAQRRQSTPCSRRVVGHGAGVLRLAAAVAMAMWLVRVEKAWLAPWGGSAFAAASWHPLLAADPFDRAAHLSLLQAPAPVSPMGGSAADYKLAAVEELSSSQSRAHARGLTISPQVRAA